MSSPSHRVFTGLAVLLLGILALSSLAIERTPPPREDPVAAPAALDPIDVSDGGVDQTSLPDMQGVPTPVQQVLYLRGKAEAIPFEQLTSIPPGVVAVLAEYGATLTVPSAPALEVAVR